MRSPVTPEEQMMFLSRRKTNILDPLEPEPPKVMSDQEIAGSRIKAEEQDDITNTSKQIEKLKEQQASYDVSKDDLRQQALLKFTGGLGADITRVAGAFGGQNVEKQAQDIAGMGSRISQDLTDRQKMVSTLGSEIDKLKPGLEASPASKQILQATLKAKSDSSTGITVPERLSQSDADKMLTMVKGLPDDEIVSSLAQTQEGVQVVTTNRRTGEVKHEVIGGLAPTVGSGKESPRDVTSPFYKTLALTDLKTRLEHPSTPPSVKALIHTVIADIEKKEAISEREYSAALATAGSGKTVTTAVTPTANESKEIRQSAISIGEAGRLADDIKASGISNNLVLKSKVSEIDNALSKWVGTPLEPEAKKVIELRAKAEGLTATIRKELFGATLTANELKSAEAFLPGPNESVESLLIKIQTNIEKLKANVAQNVKMMEAQGKVIPPAAKELLGITSDTAKAPGMPSLDEIKAERARRAAAKGNK
jgi:hypothetical protein